MSGAVGVECRDGGSTHVDTTKLGEGRRKSASSMLECKRRATHDKRKVPVEQKVLFEDLGAGRRERGARRRKVRYGVQ